MLLRVRSIAYLAQRINGYELVDPEEGYLPEFTAGAHVSVRVGNGPARDFSLWNDPAERTRYCIAVLREPEGRGSREWHERVRVGASALAHGIPTIGLQAEMVPYGLLRSYGQDFPDYFRKAAGYADKILRGAKPADLPVEQPTRFKHVINLKAAKALGLTLPSSLLVTADEVIE